MAVLDLFKRFVGTNALGGDRRGGERVRASLGARVLVVDDSATIRAVLGKMLAQDGYEVFKAADGEAAVEMAQTQFPDLIFLDIVLPGISGFAVLRSLRRDSRTRTTPIIMMSGNQQATEQFYVQRFGADGFVKKPFGRADVFHAIRSLVQAGRMPARLEVQPVATIPEGMTPEEWNAIPDVGMPDESHMAPPGPVAPVERIPTVVPTGAMPSVSAAPATPLTPPQVPPLPEPQQRFMPAVEPVVSRPVTVAVPAEPIHADPARGPAGVGEWSGAAASVPMRPSIGSRLRSVLGGMSAPAVVHARAPDPGTPQGVDAGTKDGAPEPDQD